jgi:glycosyltransferase involved in cell wall biosynthesis
MGGPLPTIFHVITTLGFGGAERMLARVIFADQGRKPIRHVVVSLLGGGYAEQIRATGVEVHNLGLDRVWRFPGAILRLVRLLRRTRPDVVMTWLYHADFLGTLAVILSGIGSCRLVWNLRCSKLDLADFAHTTRWLIKILAWLSPLPRAIAANSRAGQSAHQELGYRAKHWIYLPNGLDLDEWRPDQADRTEVRQELGLKDDAVAVGVIARLDSQKDHATLLAAAEQCSEHIRFVLIGRNTNKLPPSSRILALGERGDVPRLLRGMDIVVLSSAYGEGFPNVLAEAMATEIPCITTDVGDAASLVDDAGLVVPARDPKALAAAIMTLSSEDPESRASRGRRARDIIRRNYSMERVIELYREVWRLVAA